MKMTELRQVSEDKIGRVNKNNVDIELHEDSTILYLTQYGFNVEVVKPTNAYRTNSADIFMMGAVWEMKSPTSFKESTIKEDFRKAKEQSDRIVFDLRRVKKYADDVEKYILKLFKGGGRVRQLIIIEKSGKVLYFSK